MSVIEATVVSPTHLELKIPVSAEPGQRVYVTIVSPGERLDARLAKLRTAYLAMTDAERGAEVAWAEEGLCGQLPPQVEFPDESDAPWWE
jgi:hypothetical protein